MMGFAGYIMRGHAQAVLVALVTGILSILLLPLGYISGAALALVTLRKGPMAGGIDVLLTMLGMALVLPTLLDGDPLFGLGYALVLYVPIWLLAIILRRTISMSLTMSAAGVFGVIGVVAAYLIVADPAAWWREMMQIFFAQAEQAGVALPDPEALKNVMSKAAEIMTGFVAAMLVGSVLFSILLARWWQSLLFHPGGFRDEILNLKLDRVSALVVLAAMIATMVNLGGMSPMFTEIVIVFLCVCSIFGVTLIHFIVEKRKMSVLWLVALYLLSTILLPQIIVLTGTLALMDSWMDVRRFFNPPPSTGTT
ncbi:MAG: hypothetical protein AABY83_09490 [Pseudomonadota bacterium]